MQCAGSKPHRRLQSYGNGAALDDLANTVAAEAAHVSVAYPNDGTSCARRAGVVELWETCAGRGVGTWQMQHVRGRTARLQNKHDVVLVAQCVKLSAFAPRADRARVETAKERRIIQGSNV